MSYDGRLQPVERRVTNPSVIMELDYDFTRPSDGKNNGNVYEIRDRVNSTRDQTFDYDFYNRIDSFWNSTTGTKSYDYDRYGNRLDLSFGVSSSTNRISSSGYGYDSAGNLTSRPGDTFQYDAESKMKSIDSGSTAVFEYDGDGNRSVKTSSLETRIYFYDPFGNVILESEPIQGSWYSANVYFNGRFVWHNTVNGNFWRHQDHLGSARLRTDGTGAPIGDSLYKPFGEEVLTPPNQPASLDNYKFTGQERDRETDLDNFKARIYSWESARFLSVDPARESFDPENPQTWNRYSYTLNNPIKFVDPDGRSAQLAETAKLGAAASVIPGPQQPFVIVGTAVVVGLLVAQNPDVQAAFSEALGTVKDLFTSPGGEMSTEDVSIPGLAPAASHSLNSSFAVDGEKPDLKKPGTLRNTDGTIKDPDDQLASLTHARDKHNQLVDSRGKSKQNAKNKLRRLRGKSPKEIIEQLEKEPGG